MTKGKERERERDAWIQALKRENQNRTNWTPKSSDKICSLHFVDGIPTKANPLPTMKILKNIKIFIKSNQFLVNILLHNVVKTYSVSDFTMGCPYQARNQEFFRAGKLSENKGTSINIESATYE